MISRIAALEGKVERLEVEVNYLNHEVDNLQQYKVDVIP